MRVKQLLTSLIARILLCGWLISIAIVTINKPLTAKVQILEGFVVAVVVLMVTDLDKRLMRAVLMRFPVALAVAFIFFGYWLWLLARWETGLIPGIEHESFLIYRVEMGLLGLPSSLVGLSISGIINSTDANLMIREIFTWKGRVFVEWLCFFVPFVMQMLFVWGRRDRILRASVARME